MSGTFSNHKTTRRQFLKLGATGLALSAMPSFSLLAAEQAKVGLQLYTLRDMMAADVSKTLKLVASVGYQELEFAGYFDHSTKDIRQIMNGEGLSAPSAHIPLATFRQQGINQVIDSALEMGHQYVVIPYLSKEQRGTSIDVFKQLANECNQWGEDCRKQGLTLAYHNHDFEFQRTDGELPYHVLLNEVEAQNMVMELDLYWVVKAQQDPISYFTQHPGRFHMLHVKDMDTSGNFADVGTGTIDFAKIFAESGLAGVKHYFVERDQTPDKLRTIRQGFSATSALLNI